MLQIIRTIKKTTTTSKWSNKVCIVFSHYRTSRRDGEQMKDLLKLWQWGRVEHSSVAVHSLDWATWHCFFTAVLLSMATACQHSTAGKLGRFPSVNKLKTCFLKTISVFKEGYVNVISSNQINIKHCKCATYLFTINTFVYLGRLILIWNPGFDVYFNPSDVFEQNIVLMSSLAQSCTSKALLGVVYCSNQSNITKIELSNPFDVDCFSRFCYLSI